MKTTKEQRAFLRDSPPVTRGEFVDQVTLEKTRRLVIVLLDDLEAAETRAVEQDAYAHQCEAEIVALTTERDRFEREAGEADCRNLAYQREIVALTAEVARLQCQLDACEHDREKLRARVASLEIPCDPDLSGWCPVCGPLRITWMDGDGCCRTCGSTAEGEGATDALRLRARALSDEEIKRVVWWHDVVEDAHRTGACDGDLRDKLAALLPKGGTP